MTELHADPSEAGDIALIVRRTIRAPVGRVFEAWTKPEHLRRWWGPASVRCPEAEVDLRVGGGYRIANEFPDGKVSPPGSEGTNFADITGDQGPENNCAADCALIA